MDFPKRIEQLLSALSMNQTAFAKALGVSRGIISEFSSGAREPSKDFLFGISKLGVSLDWFLTGEGPMFIHLQDSVPNEKWETVSHLDQAEKNEPVSHLDEAEKNDTRSLLNDHNKNETVSHFHAIPDHGGDLAEEFQPAAVLKSGTRLMGRRKIEVAMEEADHRVGFVAYIAQPVSAGPGRDMEALYETARLPVMLDFIYPWRPDQVIALQVRGDSMTGVGIFDFDIVLYVPTRREKDEGDGIYVISVDNKMLVKRLEFDLFNGHIRIISENERYSPKELRGEDSDRMTIEGKVIGWLHRHPY